MTTCDRQATGGDPAVHCFWKMGWLYDDNMWNATIVYLALCDNMWQVEDRRRSSGSLFSPKRETCEGIKEKEGATRLRPDVAKNVLWETKVFPDPEELLLHLKVYIQRREGADYMAVIWSEQCVSFPISPMCPYLSHVSLFVDYSQGMWFCSWRFQCLPQDLSLLIKM